LDIDGSRSSWAMCDYAKAKAVQSISQRLEYYRRSEQGLPARIYGMCFSPKRLTSTESAWGSYCPVEWTVNNALVGCTDPRFKVEYKGRIFWLSSQENMELFFGSPESFLEAELPTSLPIRGMIQEKCGCALQDYCPVAIVDSKELIKGTGHHVIYQDGELYNLHSKEAARKFMQRPAYYVRNALLPPKRPVLRNERSDHLLEVLSSSTNLDPSDMVSYMQASVAELICQALIASGDKRPLYPGKSAKESALLFLAKFLRAKNPINTTMFAGKVRAEFDAFLSDCALPATLGELTQTKNVMESAGTWTKPDARKYEELCARFDTLYDLQA